ncbi:MAG: hypothetical protein ACRDY0_08345, partial [Acidimicrobiales bacterium]
RLIAGRGYRGAVTTTGIPAGAGPAGAVERRAPAEVWSPTAGRRRPRPAPLPPGSTVGGTCEPTRR